MDKELQELWEACGFKSFGSFPIKDFNTNADKGMQDLWEYPDGGLAFLPILTLDDLFKYAYPIIREKLGMLRTEALLRKWLNSFIWRTEDPAQALYQIFRKVLIK